MEDCSLGLLHSFGFVIFLLSSEYMLRIVGYQSGLAYVVFEIE